MTERLRVLLVEDCEDDALLIARELQRIGHTLEWTRVETADQVRAALEREAWDLVVADYALPGFTALNALAILQESGQDLPFIVVSGTIGEETAVVAMKAGAHDYMMKSNLCRLNPVIERELREAAVRRQRRAAEAALRDSEAQLATIFNSAPVAMLLVDRGLQLHRINRVGCELSGRPAEELLGEVVGHALGCLHSLENPRGCQFAPSCRNCSTSQAIHRTLTDGTSQKTVEARMPVSRDRNRSVLHFLVSTAPIELAGEQLVLVCLEDITDRKRAADALAQYAAALEQTNRKLDASRKELEQFIYSSSHDLRSPIVSIHGFATLLKERAGGQMDEQSSRYVERIRANAETIEALLRDLLHISRINPREMVAQEISMAALAHTVLEGLEPRARDRGIRLTCATDLPRVRGHQQGLQEVLGHLLDNAIKFMPARGDGVVEVGYDAHVATPDGKRGAFFVRDNGAGIAPQYHQRIFQLFHRGPRAASDTSGTGVGLAIVKRIVNAHGGLVWLESSPGEGATFFFSLAPADNTSIVPLATTSPDATPTARSESRAA